MISMGTYVTLVFASVLSLSTFALGESQSDFNIEGHTKKVQIEQGDDLSVSCHDSRSSWTGPHAYQSSGEWLNISRVALTDAGTYKCTSKDFGNLLSVDLDVTYPAYIVSITVPKREFSMRDDFTMEVEVRGNPPPETRLTFVPEDKVVFEKIGEGKYTIVVKNLNCTDGGIYELTCNNSLATKQVAENITVMNKPKLDPMYITNRRILPRLGDSANFTAHIISCPPALFIDWSHASKPDHQHNDTNSSSVLFLDDVNTDSYGDYELKLGNIYGDTSISFFAEAFGPPASITDLGVSDVTAMTANISFISGFDYNDTETFMVMREVDGQLKSLRNIPDVPNDKGGPTSFIITDLDEITSYNITVVSHNTRGNSAPASTFVAFTTFGSPKPDPKYPIHHETTPRLGESVNFTIHCLADPEPSFQWLHDGKHVKSLDSNATCGSTVMVDNIVVDDFGSYMLEMHNTYGEYNVSFEMKATGPPAPVSDLKITNVSTSAATITFTTGYNYNKTQTFVVKQKSGGKVQDMAECSDTTDGKGGAELSCEIDNLKYLTVYYVTVASKNDDGVSVPSTGFIEFTTYGSPKPDPKYPIQHETTPRLGDSVNFTIHCLADPEPSFQWLHDGKQVKSLDSNETCGSTVMVDNIVVDDFGSYMLEMKNTYGEYNVSFEMKATGPPAPVSDLRITNVSTSGATITFTTGYNYNKTQTFVVKQKSGGKVQDMTECNDTTDGKGGAELSCEIDNLKNFTVYYVTVASKNDDGVSVPSTGFIEFTTYGSPKPDPKYPITNKYKPRVRDVLNLTVHAIGEPVPTFEWMHNGKVFNSSDKGYMSTLELDGVNVDEFGNFTVNVTNVVGSYTNEFVLIPDGPPDSVTDLKLGVVNTSSASLNFSTGYNYDKKQVFIVLHNEDGHLEVMAECNDTTSGKGGAPFSCKLDKLKQDTLYNVTVVSENSEGESNASKDFIQFTTYGAPKPDPKFPVKDKFKPRLGQTVNLTAHAIGYPVPKFEWMHDGKPVKSEDTGYTSTVDLDMKAEEFGNYTVKITNTAGSYVAEYEIIADGPPSPATNLTCVNKTENSATIQWMAGFNYGNKQDFKVMQVVENGVDSELDDVDDITDGMGGKIETKSLKSLVSGTTYTVYLIAENTKGVASQSNKVTFTTAASKGSSGPSAAGIAGIVIGSLAAVVLIAVIVVFIRRRRSNYEQFGEERKSHHYSYDDRP